MSHLMDWFRRQFENPQIMFLMSMLVGVVAVVFFMGSYLGPVFAAVIIAYLMQGLVAKLEQLGVNHMLATVFAFVLFVLVLFLILFGLLPSVARQMSQLVKQIPVILNGVQDLFFQLQAKYPQYVSGQQITDFVKNIGAALIEGGQGIVGFSLNSIVTVMQVLLYLVLVPLLVFFMIRDREKITNWFRSFVPENYELAEKVWMEVNDQIGNYIRGKVWEILIVGVAAYLVFRFLNLQYAELLAVLTGVSVLIPYIGAAAVTVPVCAVAFFQFGWGVELAKVFFAYGVLQALDGNVLVPWLFSEVVDLHPVAIIVAILFFGGIWGFWGLFFAIPIATVVQATLRSWPRAAVKQEDVNDGVDADPGVQV
ncbi:MAG: AI-2E family transporter [Gammaproteobacteria bacterium]|nr:AI-2E family transporter [Gammaproteobacteria bacterium]